jgi:hypothetical protein
MKLGLGRFLTYENISHKFAEAICNILNHKGKAGWNNGKDHRLGNQQPRIDYHQYY